MSGPTPDTNPLVYACYGGFNGDKGTANFGATSFANAAPSGFSAWGGSATWDPSFASALLVFSNGNLTAASTASSTWRWTRSTTSHNAGKWYWEVHLDVVSASFDTLVGIVSGIVTNANAGTTPGFGGAPYNSGACWQSGQAGILNNGGVSGPNPGTYAQGDTIGIAVDVDAKLLWFRDGAGNWNGSGANDPATGTGGFNFSSFWGYGAAPGQTGATLGAGGTASCTCSLSTTQTDDLIVFVGFESASAPGSVTPSVSASGISFTQRGTTQGSNPYIAEFYATNVPPLIAKTITAQMACSGTPGQSMISVIAMGFQNANVSSPFDPNASVPVAGGAPLTPTLNQSSDCGVICQINSISNTVPTVTGWTLQAGAGGQFGGAQGTIGVSTLSGLSSGGQTWTWGAITNFAVGDALQPSVQTETGQVALAIANPTFSISASDPSFTRHVGLAIANPTFSANVVDNRVTQAAIAITHPTFAVTAHREEDVTVGLAVAHPGIAAFVTDLSALNKLRQFTTFG